MSKSFSCNAFALSIPYKLLLSSLGLMLMSLALPAQVSITCPPNTIVATDSGMCGAVANYSVTITGGGSVNVPFAFTGAVQTWTVPLGVSTITIEAWGAQGNTSALGVTGGLGGYAIGTLNVSSGEVLNIYVGGGGVMSTSGGFNGGGNAGTVGCATALGGGGGGASDVRLGGTALTDRILIAGGGGGAGGNRVSGCGRGTGGGGGGGYYGGGGGAAWPYTSTILPSGGTQSAGGIAGQSDWTSVPNNDGFPGALGIGGNGGDETSSPQSGSATGLGGGAGGGTSGGPGQYLNNFTGQSGAGGSGYIGSLTGASMTSGVRTGNGQVIISYQTVDSVYMLQGLASGQFFPAGTTTNVLVASHAGNNDTCSFNLTVNDSTAPSFTCPVMDTLFLNSNCEAPVLDYGASILTTDNCTSVPIETQSPAAGTPLSGLGSLHPITFHAADSAGNIDSCSFAVFLWDNTPPTLNCPNQEFTPNTFDCNPLVTYTAPTITDNCGGVASYGSPIPGGAFPVGVTMISYYAMDSVGNIDSCSFALTVNTPLVDGFVTISPAAACVGDTFTLTADPGFSAYIWSTGATTTVITSTTPGGMWVELTDSAGCTARDSVMVPQFQVPQPVVTPNGASLCTGSFVSYQWLVNGSPIPGATSQCFQPTTSGTFSVIVTDNLGCTGTSDTLGFVGVKDGYANPGFDLFPNPAGSMVKVMVHQPLMEAGVIKVYDLAGRVVLSRAFEDLQGAVSLDLSALAKGSYVVKVEAGEFAGQRKLMHLE
jgi:hypothetical protein